MTRGDLPESLRQIRELDGDWRALGLTPSSYTPGIIITSRTEAFLFNSVVELLSFAYLAQCRCDPGDTIRYFTALVNIVQTMQLMNEDTPMDLQNLILDERTRGRFTRDDFLKAVNALGFGHDGPLRVEFDESVEEEFIISAWRDGIRRSWKDETNGSVIRRELNDALKIIAEARGSGEMHRVWEREKGSVMTVDTAYSTLGVSKEMDENTLITVFDMRVSGFHSTVLSVLTLQKVEEQASQVDKLREAMSVIAEVTQSQRLKVFLDTGRDRESQTPLLSPCNAYKMLQLATLRCLLVPTCLEACTSSETPATLTLCSRFVRHSHVVIDY